MVKKITFIARAALLMLLLVAPSYMVAEVIPWVELSSDFTVLTFHYNDKIDKADDAWKLPDKGWPEWSNFGVYAHKIKRVVFDPEFASARPTYCGHWFKNMPALEKITGMEYLNTSEVTSMQAMFRGSSGLKNIDLRHLDTSKVTDMSEMFAGTSLDSLDLTSFDTRKVTTTEKMFNGCTELKYILVSDKFKLDSVTNSNQMFCDCTSLPNYNEKVVDKTQASALLTNMDQAEKKPWVLYNASDSSLTFRYDGWKPYITAGVSYDVPTSGKPDWLTDTTGSEDNSETVAARVTKVIIGSDFIAAEVPSTAYWFSGMSRLTTIEGLDYINTSRTTDMTEMFAGCKSLTSLDINNNFLVRDVKSLRGMFDGCTGLASLNFKDFMTENAEDMSRMFRNCSQLTSLPTGRFVTQNVTSMAEMFAGCESLKELELSQFKTAKVTNMESMFHDCKSLSFLDLSKFDNSQVMSVKGMFNGCSSLDSIYVSDKFLPVSTCDATDMFKGCVNLPNYDASVVGKEKALDVKQKGYLNIVEASALPWVEYADGTLTFHNDNQKYYTTSEIACALPGNTTPAWISKAADVKKVEFNQEFASVCPEYCVSWFSGMKQIASIEGLYYLNTSAVVSMQAMFYNCENLTSLDLSKFNTANVTNMQGMFNNCSSLKNIFVTNSFSTDAVEQSQNMFTGCVKLKNYNNSDAHDKEKACDTSKGGYLNNWDVIPVVTWVEYQESDGSLTFRHDKLKGIIDATDVYYLPDGSQYDLTPAWNERADKIKKVIFYEDFQDVRPVTCYKWFDSMVNLTEIQGLTNLNTENVTTMEYMFNNCNNKQLTVLDLTSFNTSRVIDMTYMFYGCNNLKEIVVSDAFVTTNVLKSDSLFYGCANLKKYYVSNKENYYGIGKAKYILDGGYFSQPVPFVWASYSSASKTATFYYDRTGDWDYAYLYKPVSGWSGDCKYAQKAVIDESFANYKTTDMSYLFCCLSYAKELQGMENLNTEGVTNMSHMFEDGSFTYLDLTHFDTREVTDMTSMFDCCSATQNIYVTKDFTVDKVTQSNNMFYYCKNLPNYYDGYKKQNKDYASYTGWGYLTLRQHFRVGDKTYNIDQNSKQTHPFCYENIYIDNQYAKDNFQSDAEFWFADDNQARYSRSLKEKWGTLCLPFSFDVEENSFTECYFYTIDHIDNDNVIVKEVTTGTIEAGTPLIFARRVTTQEALNLVGVKNSKVVVAPNDGLLTGTFDTTYIADGSSYYLNGDKFCKAPGVEEGSVAVKPFCAYITPGEEGAGYASVLNIKVDDGTGIDNVVDALNNADGKTEIYDLNGRRLDHPQKGVNIVKNGSRTIKVTVK